MMEKKYMGFIFLGSIVLTTIISRTNSEKLVIDTDAGGDDAFAIAFVLSVAKNASGLEVIAITCVYGNTVIENVEINVLKTLTIINKTKIPVYSGAYGPLIGQFKTDYYFGNDGFGDFEFPEKIVASIDRSKHAAIALIELAKKHAGNLSILALGPSTNIALAIKMDPNFMKNIKRLYMIGGSAHGVGNMDPGVEFNFGLDPESTFIVLNSTKAEKPILLLPWETITKSNISTEWRNEIKSKTMDVLNKANARIKTKTGWKPADPLIAALMMWPELSENSEFMNLHTMTCGDARGGVLVDWYNHTSRSVNVEIVENVNLQQFKELFKSFMSQN